MAGQIVMEGFLRLRMRPWLRRLLTRLVAIVPAIVTIAWTGEQGTYSLLIFSQIVLSLQLPFAVIPLIHLTSDSEKMGPLASSFRLKAGAWICAALILGLNAWLVARSVSGWAWIAIVPIAALLTYIAAEPWLPRSRPSAPVLPPADFDDLRTPSFASILVPLDHSPLDRVAVTHASALAKSHGSKILLLHVEEGVASQVYGDAAQSAEEQEGARYLRRIEERLAAQSIDSESIVAYSTHPRDEIVRTARKRKPDLIVMGAHGHKAFQDLVFGSTINAVRHKVDIPVLVVRSQP
jgi:manganese transport protein